jgi:hypothetical protein
MPRIVALISITEATGPSSNLAARFEIRNYSRVDLSINSGFLFFEKSLNEISQPISLDDILTAIDSYLDLGVRIELRWSTKFCLFISRGWDEAVKPKVHVISSLLHLGSHQLSGCCGSQDSLIRPITEAGLSVILEFVRTMKHMVSIRGNVLRS